MSLCSKTLFLLLLNQMIRVTKARHHLDAGVQPRGNCATQFQKQQTKALGFLEVFEESAH